MSFKNNINEKSYLSFPIIIDFIIVISIPVASILYMIVNISKNEAFISLSLLSIIFGLVAFKHSEEMLSLKQIIVVMYLLISIVGFMLIFFISSSLPILYFFIIPAMGTSTLLIPGVFRFILFLLGFLRKTKKPGILEAISLVYLRTPWQIQEVRNAMKYTIYSNPWKTRIKNFLNTQFVIALLVNIIKLMYILAEVTINRKYQVTAYCPKIHLTSFERLTYFMTFCILIGLGFFYSI